MSQETFKFTVKENDKGLRLDQALMKAGFTASRAQALKLIKSQAVVHKNKPLKASHRVMPGEIFHITIESKKKSLPISKNPIESLYEDNEILVINKPAGLVVHPAPGHGSDTLVNRLIFDKKLSPGTDPLRPGVVHRLDKDVSGLLVFAKTPSAETHLVEQFKSRQVKRIYWAITSRPPESPENRIETYLSRHPKKRKIFISSKEPLPGGKKAVTFYKTLKSNPSSGLTWLECRLKTGRTHQIRLHLSSLGCPLIGDKTYSSLKKVYSFKNQTLLNLCRSLNRIALHARFLSFTHPATEKSLSFSSPWPEDLKPLTAVLDFDRDLNFPTSEKPLL